jgi:dienelactone hydrolase
MFGALAAAPNWNLETLFQPPDTFAVENGPNSPGVQSIFIEGMPFKGQETRMFCWYGTPERRENDRVPAMVLVHGGGGNAYADWVRVWTGRGYAALAIDLYGCLGRENELQEGDKTKHAWPGPAGYGDPRVSADRIEDDWAYHAIGNTIRAHSFLRSLPEIAPDRIGITGISWGGFVAAIVPALDTRFAFSIPVYGCGFLGEAAAWNFFWDEMGGERSKEWLDTWDPSVYVPRIAMPTLWVDGSNDPWFPVSIQAKTYAICGGDRRLSIQMDLMHSHTHGMMPEEIYVFADSIVGQGSPLLRITDSGSDGNTAWLTYTGDAGVSEATFVYASGTPEGKEVSWIEVPVAPDRTEKRVEAILPDDSHAWFFNIRDSRGLVVSSPCQDVTRAD